MSTTLQQAHAIDTGALKKFAQAARRQLREQVAAQLDRVLKSDSAELREKGTAINELNSQIATSSREAVIDRVAYTWFNRFCALRFMDVNHYTRTGTVSPADGFTQPEILAEAKQGHIDDIIKTFLREQRVFDLLAGRIPSRDPQQEAYRLLIVAVCNYYNSIMPFLFEKIADYTELLMPNDLLSDSSILAEMRATLTEDSCRNVEIIGWLYQFYISEKKDEVFEGLKKNKKITPENIPAATQLFTPHWIVRYLVENSLGHLWMLNKPASRLIDRMDYYIKPEQAESDFLRVSKPEEIRICDPACGSGHMLVYAFDLLYAIYEEEGYESTEIPGLILKNNLYGIEIDERAGELAAFALAMKAREKYRRFFSKPTQPNICVLENIKFEEGELPPYLEAVGHNLFTENLRKTLHQFQECDNFGSLIRPTATDVATLVGLLEAKNISGNIFLHKTHERVIQALRYADYLSPKYHVVIANPPYMGGKGMNGRLGDWAKQNYPNSKSDLFAMFIERSLDLAMNRGSVAMITMQSWMYITSFEKLRRKIYTSSHIRTMAHLGERAFDTIGGAVVSTTAFVLGKEVLPSYRGVYLRLVDGSSELEKSELALQAIRSNQHSSRFKASTNDFSRIAGLPIQYSLSERMFSLFSWDHKISDLARTASGLQTNDNGRFIRFWYEPSQSKVSFESNNREESIKSGCRWFPHVKGGTFRKWYGNLDYVVNWENDGSDIFRLATDLYGSPTRTVKNLDLYFSDGVTWTDICSGEFGVREIPKGFIFDTSAPSAFSQHKEFLIGLLNSKPASTIVKLLCPSLHFLTADIAKVPIEKNWITSIGQKVIPVANSLLIASKDDWNAYETSWDFTNLPLLNPSYREATLELTYHKLRVFWYEMTADMKRLEEDNNRIFMEAYGLQEELHFEVPLHDVTLTCNPQYRYGNDKSGEELEALLLTDTMRELASYAVGCMFGRYSLDKPGLVLASQGETKEDYLKEIPEPSFPVDVDNVIPMLDGDWFSDDVAERFRKFLRVTFGDEHYQENLEFIERALGKDIRKYFVKDFYNDHVKRYKKRPIYWLFSSPKGSFNALIYMHRYRPDTVSVVLNDYLREFRTKLDSRKSHLEAVSISSGVSPVEKTKSLKEIESLKKVIDELESYEREVLYPLATQQLAIDLDDGVKVNYAKFGKALKTIPGLASEED